MFQELQISDWSAFGGVLALFTLIILFIAIVVKTIRYPKSKIEKLENLPWEDDRKP